MFLIKTVTIIGQGRNVIMTSNRSQNQYLTKIPNGVGETSDTHVKISHNTFSATTCSNNWSGICPRPKQQRASWSLFGNQNEINNELNTKDETHTHLPCFLKQILLQRNWDATRRKTFLKLTKANALSHNDCRFDDYRTTIHKNKNQRNPESICYLQCACSKSWFKRFIGDIS